jgi:putative methyltransferase (TIGR04325 family)
MASYAQLVRDLTPPAFWNFGKRRLPWLVRSLGGHYTHIRYSGDYRDFAEARRASKGYDAPAVLATTREALLKVKRGQNRWERDAMVSDSDELPWSLLACLMRVVLASPRRELNVLDFGGSLGSTYFWCRRFFGDELRVRWHIVEQAEHVKVGRTDFASDELSFDFSVPEVLAQHRVDVVLLSGVIHYLENPEAFLESVTSWKIPFLILDRTPLWEKERHRLTVQEVPPEIYSASYPAWFLSKRRVLDLIERDYDMRVRAPDTEVWEIDDQRVQNSLWFFERKGNSHATP